jgi:hypothetical protein
MGADDFCETQFVVEGLMAFMLSGCEGTLLELAKGSPKACHPGRRDYSRATMCGGVNFEQDDDVDT